ncbi:MAG: OmpH family outer membrane protein [Bacteroidales bacterium]|nr:OmpH family outer membrane protein [Bacteroidales bacterium]MCF6341337.1 OmpH family outer membrane protein [Bacteroidales bacterium]
MKNRIKITLGAVVVLLSLAVTPAAYGQKYAYVDTEYILDNIPEFQDAQEELNGISSKWQKEIEEAYAEVEELYKNYQAEAVLLPDDVKRKREDAIVAKEKNVKDLQRKYFGPEGDLFKKRQELVQPIQEKVFNAIETIATTRNFAFVFDKAGGMTLLYGNPKYDISDDVLDEVGNVMQTVKLENRKRKN